ncbi:MAG: hypothetical protein ACYCPQ_01215 [Elusimicrobiota bacterium]
MPQRLSVGIGHNLELDLYPNFIYNYAGYPTTTAGTSVSNAGLGNTHAEIKYQATADADTNRFFADPSIGLKAILWIPTGNYQNLSQTAYNTDQLGNGTWNEGLSVLLRKRFRPFQIYTECGEVVEDPTRVGGGYQFNNNMAMVPFGTSDVRMVDGNLLFYGAAFEQVLNDRSGLGYVLEFYGQTQSSRSLLWSGTNAPAWSFLSFVPTLEFTWPNTAQFQMTWGAALAYPLVYNGYPKTITPIFTVTFYFNSARGHR